MQDALAVVGDFTLPKAYSTCTVHQDVSRDMVITMPRLHRHKSQGLEIQGLKGRNVSSFWRPLHDLTER